MENTIGLWFGMGVRCLFTALFGALVLRASCTMLNWFFGSAVKFETITEPVDPKPNTSPEPEDPDSLDRPYRFPDYTSFRSCAETDSKERSARTKVWESFFHLLNGDRTHHLSRIHLPNMAYFDFCKSGNRLCLFAIDLRGGWLSGSFIAGQNRVAHDISPGRWNRGLFSVDRIGDGNVFGGFHPADAADEWL